MSLNFHYKDSANFAKRSDKKGLEEALLCFIKRREGFRREVYLDAAGLRTIGYGHLIKPKDKISGNIIEKPEALELLKSDLEAVKICMAHNIKVDLKACQYIALASFIFNVGEGAFIKSTLLKHLNAGNPEKVPAELKRWCYIKQEVSNGLMNRRIHESSMWIGEDLDKCCSELVSNDNLIHPAPVELPAPKVDTHHKPLVASFLSISAVALTSLADTLRPHIETLRPVMYVFIIASILSSALGTYLMFKNRKLNR